MTAKKRTPIPAPDLPRPVNPVVQLAADHVKNQKMRIRVKKTRRRVGGDQLSLFEIPGVTK